MTEYRRCAFAIWHLLINKIHKNLDSIQVNDLHSKKIEDCHLHLLKELDQLLLLVVSKILKTRLNMLR